MAFMFLVSAPPLPAKCLIKVVVSKALLTWELLCASGWCSRFSVKSLHKMVFFQKFVFRKDCVIAMFILSQYIPRLRNVNHLSSSSQANSFWILLCVWIYLLWSIFRSGTKEWAFFKLRNGDSLHQWWKLGLGRAVAALPSGTEQLCWEYSQ